MIAGELFVNLGIVGADKTVGALGDVTKGMGNVKSMSLEAKAGILSALYALEQMTATSGKVGTTLTNLGSLLNINTDELQKWEYGMRQAGGTSEEMDSIIKKISDSMAQVDFGKGIPEGFALLSQAAGGIDFSKKEDPFYMTAAYVKGIKNMMNSPKSAALSNFLSHTVGLTDNFISGSRRGKFDRSVLDKAPIYSKGELAANDANHIAWENLGTKWDMGIGRLNAKHGGQLVKDIGAITDAVLKLIDSLETLSEKISLFEKLGGVLTGTANTLKLISEIVDKFGGKESKKGDLLYYEGDLFPRNGFKEASDNDRYNLTKSIGVQLERLAGGQSSQSNTTNVHVIQNGVKDTHHGVKNLEKHLEQTTTQKSLKRST